MRKLGKYEVLGELGHGAMGVVYRARDPIINRMVALKTITTGLADDPNLLERFYREAQSAGGLQHPNIVTIYDMGDEQSTPYIAMELIDGESLEQMIARHTHVPLTIKLTYAIQACRAFDYAHKRGIVHRDIKPGNVMVNKEGVVKVVDFGIARVLDTSKTQTGMLIGTFAYMSPEQYYGEHADERSDIWSFGVLLYELICDQRPFTGENPARLMNSICSQEPRPLAERVPDCPPALEAIIGKILRKSPEERFQSMEDLLLELEPVYKELQSRSILALIDEGRRLIEAGEFSQARELLRESLKVDSTNSQARGLLEKVNAELRRLSIRPKAQQQVEKGRALLKEGKVQEARAEAESALQLDSEFEPARELMSLIGRELDRARRVAEWLQACEQRLAEGLPDEAEELLARVFELEPANKQGKDLEQQILAERAERGRRSEFQQKMQEARALWSRLDYDGSMAILYKLQKEFAGEEEIERLIETVQEDQAEQRKQRILERARNDLAIGNYEESRALLADLQKQFPADEEIPRLLEDIRLDETKQRKLQRLAEARNFLANRQYGDCIAQLTALEEEFRGDREILQLLEVARADQAEQQKRQAFEEARNLLTLRRYEECTALLADLERRFPKEKEISNLQRAVREGQAEQNKQEKLANVRKLFALQRWQESIALLGKLEKEFPADQGIAELMKAARIELAEEERDKGLALARTLLDERQYEESDALLAKLEKQFPGHAEVLELQRAARKGQADEQRRQGLAEAKELLAARRYEECNALIAGMRRRFPEDPDLVELEAKIAEAQAEEQKVRNLAKAEALLSSKNYEDSIQLLAGLARDFPKDQDIRGLLERATRDRAEQERQQHIAVARKLLGAKHYAETGALLEELRRRFPADSETAQLEEALRSALAEQEKLESLVKARNLLAKRKYEECISLLSGLGAGFPNDEEIIRLAATARDGLAEQQKLGGLTQARNLLGGHHYGEALALLTKLNNEFPDDREISRLVANASKEQAEQEKHRKLVEGRALLAAQRFDEALALLDSLLLAHPKDTAVQKLRTLVEREHEKQVRSERLERELEALKKLMSERKYAELLAQAEPLRADFPVEGDLLRLIEFAREQQGRLESEKRLRAAIDTVKARLSENLFTEAVLAADAGLRGFPENSELQHLREQAEAQQKKQRARSIIEQRIREIKFKINRQDLSEAISLAKETIASVGPDTDLAQLLNSATVELEAREKKRRQEQKLEEVRTLVESGDVDRAAETLREATEGETLDPLDPRVGRVWQQIETIKSTPTVPPTVAAPASAGFSKEYAFFQGPVETEPSPTEDVGPTAAGIPQASATQPIPSPQPAVWMPPESEERPEPSPEAIRSEPLPASLPLSRPGRPSERAPSPREAIERPVETKPARHLRASKQAILLAVIALGLILGVWATVHVLSRRANEERALRLSQPSAAPAANPNPTTTLELPKPEVSQEETEQRKAMAQSDKQVASGDLPGALASLEAADKLKGPLSPEIEKREAAVEDSMRNESLAKSRQQEAALWQQATTEVDKAQFEAAKRDLQKIVASDEGGPYQADAERYLSDVLPKRQQEEEVFRQAQQSSQADDQQDLEHAANLLNQVVAFDGPRKLEAEELDRSVESKLAALDEKGKRQIESLEAEAQSNIQKGDLVSARQNATQIAQLGGDSAGVSRAIAQAQASQDQAAQQQKAFQQAVEAYAAIGSQDKTGLEKARSDFLAIVREHGPGAAEAQQYVNNIDKRLESLSQPPSPQPSPVALEEGAIRAALDQFNSAFSDRRPREVTAIWPKADRKYLDAMNPGGGFGFTMQLTQSGPIQIIGDKATVLCNLVSTTTEPGGQSRVATEQKRVALEKTGDHWLIVDPLAKP